MLSKIYIFIFLFVASFSVSQDIYSHQLPCKAPPYSAALNKSYTAETYDTGNTYVRVTINGKHYIYEYAPDGSLVSVIEVEE